MKSYTSELSWTEIIDCLQSNSSSGLILDGKTAYVSVKVDTDKVKVIGMVFTGLLIRGKDEIKFKVDYHWTIKMVIVFAIAFFSVFLVSDKVTINGEKHPEFVWRLLYSIGGIAMFWGAGKHLIFSEREVFEKKIVDLIKLKPVANNR